jgi:hypothetical protein
MHMKKRESNSKKLVVAVETIRDLAKQDRELVKVAGGRFPYSAASHQDVCCA